MGHCFQNDLAFCFTPIWCLRVHNFKTFQLGLQAISVSICECVFQPSNVWCFAQVGAPLVPLAGGTSLSFVEFNLRFYCFSRLALS